MENQLDLNSAANADLSYVGQPVEAYLYFPSVANQYVQKSKTKILRWFFDGQIKMIPQEEQSIKEFE